MKIREILSKEPEVIAPEASLTEAARKMKEGNFGILPVCDGQRLIGCLTDRDIAIRCVAEGKNPQTMKVSDAMTPKLFYCFEDDDIEAAAKLMEEHQVRRLPVISREKRLVGIVSLGDLAVRSGTPELTEEVLEEVSAHT